MMFPFDVPFRGLKGVLLSGCLVLGLALGPTPAAAQTIIYVDADASAPGTGTSWGTAYPAVQDAFDQVFNHPGRNYEIWVAEGTYYPDIDHVDNDGSGDTEHEDNDRTESFTFIHDGRALYGGFAGTETSRSARDPTSHVVTLSGDLKQNDTGGSGRSENAYHVLELFGETVNGTAITGATVIDGVTIEGGKANDFSGKSGGGLRCQTEHTADGECSPTIRNVTFLANTAEAYGGGASFVAKDSGDVRPTITNTTFANNEAAGGGGVAFYLPDDQTTAKPEFTNVVFSGNFAGTSGGGALLNDAGGGTGNVANPTFTNVTFTKNASNVSGGAIKNYGFSQMTDPSFTNVILWGNSADADSDGVGAGDEIYSSGSSAQPSVQYSIVEGGTGGITTENGSSVSYDGGTSLNQNPEFVDSSDRNGPDDLWGTTDDGLRLRGASYATASPAVDVGSDGAVPTGITSDITGRPRTHDGDGDGSGTVDLGAYEYSGTPLPVELASFEATQTGEQAVELTWTTAAEQNNAGYRVQHRGPESDTWSTLGFVESSAGGGTTTQAQSYQFTAEDLAVGTHDFRLKQMDLDGTTTAHDPVSVKLQMQEALQLGAPSPNPVRGQTTLSFAVREQTEAVITVYNTLGQKVRTLYQGAPTAGERQTVNLEAEDLPSGVYFLRLRAGGETKTRRVTVVR